jgi:hypothetical protein
VPVKEKEMAPEKVKATVRVKGPETETVLVKVQAWG